MLTPTVVTNLGLCLAFTVAGVLVSGWCSHQTWTFRSLIMASKQLKIQNQSSNQRNSQIVNQSNLRRATQVRPLFPWITQPYFTASEFASLLKVCANISMTLTLTVQSAAYIIAYICTSHGQSWEQFSIEDDTSEFRQTITVSGVMVTVSFYLKMLSFFEQLRTTFAQTKYRLPPQKSTYLIYTLSIIGLIWVLLSIIVSQKNHVFRTLMSVVFLIGYSSVTIAIVYAFVHRTLDIASIHGTITDHNHQHESSSSLDQGLMEVAVRISVCVFIAMLVTSLDIFLTLLLNKLCHICWLSIVLQSLLFSLDFSINCYCLMSTFSDGKRYYYHFLGHLHSAIVMRLLRVDNDVDRPAIDPASPRLIENEIATATQSAV